MFQGLGAYPLELQALGPLDSLVDLMGDEESVVVEARGCSLWLQPEWVDTRFRDFVLLHKEDFIRRCIFFVAICLFPGLLVSDCYLEWGDGGHVRYFVTGIILELVVIVSGAILYVLLYNAQRINPGVSSVWDCLPTAFGRRLCRLMALEWTCCLCCRSISQYPSATRRGSSGQRTLRPKRSTSRARRASDIANASAGPSDAQLRGSTSHSHVNGTDSRHHSAFLSFARKDGFSLRDRLKLFRSFRVSKEPVLGCAVAATSVGQALDFPEMTRLTVLRRRIFAVAYVWLLLAFGVLLLLGRFQADGARALILEEWQIRHVVPLFSMMPIVMAVSFSFYLSAVMCLLVSVTFSVLVVTSESFSHDHDIIIHPNITSSVTLVLLPCVALFVNSLLHTLMSYARDRSLRQAFVLGIEQYRNERKSWQLLESMLPYGTIAKLREGETFIYEMYDQVSVLFVDVYGFAKLTKSYRPRQLLDWLHQVYCRFDTMTKAHGVYKVETVGSVYLISSNCPEEAKRADHAEALCRLAVDMRRLSGGFGVATMPDLKLQLRFGIHTGPVIAGVVGSKFPRYRLMGDVVNTASRMSTTCKPGQIQLSKAAYQAVTEGAIECVPLEHVQVKGKGLMETYLLLRLVRPHVGGGLHRSSSQHSFEDDMATGGSATGIHRRRGSLVHRGPFSAEGLGILNEDAPLSEDVELPHLDTLKLEAEAKKQTRVVVIEAGKSSATVPVKDHANVVFRISSEPSVARHEARNNTSVFTIPGAVPAQREDDDDDEDLIFVRAGDRGAPSSGESTPRRGSVPMPLPAFPKSGKAAAVGQAEPPTPIFGTFDDSGDASDEPPPLPRKGSDRSQYSHRSSSSDTAMEGRGLVVAATTSLGSGNSGVAKSKRSPKHTNASGVGGSKTVNVIVRSGSVLAYNARHRHHGHRAVYAMQLSSSTDTGVNSGSSKSALKPSGDDSDASRHNRSGDGDGHGGQRELSRKSSLLDLQRRSKIFNREVQASTPKAARMMGVANAGSLDMSGNPPSRTARRRSSLLHLGSSTMTLQTPQVHRPYDRNWQWYARLFKYMDQSHHLFSPFYEDIIALAYTTKTERGIGKIVEAFHAHMLVHSKVVAKEPVDPSSWEADSGLFGDIVLEMEGSRMVNRRATSNIALSGQKARKRQSGSTAAKKSQSGNIMTMERDRGPSWWVRLRFRLWMMLGWMSMAFTTLPKLERRFQKTLYARKLLLDRIFAGDGRSVGDMVDAEGWCQVSDADALGAVCTRVLDAHPDEVMQYLSTRRKRILGFFMKEALDATERRANPKLLSQTMQALLDARAEGIETKQENVAEAGLSRKERRRREHQAHMAQRDRRHRERFRVKPEEEPV